MTVTSLVASTVAASLLAVGSAAAFEISSSSVSDGKWDKKYIGNKLVGCDGQNISPPLTWKDLPAGTKSLALTLYDPDALTGSGLWHWQVWNIPATATGLPEGAGSQGSTNLPEGAVQGKGDAGRPGYLGACPPPGTGLHHYTFTLFALKVDKLAVDPNASGAFIGYNLNGNALAKATAVYSLNASQ